MAPLAARALPLTLRRAARAVGRGVELRDGADVARRGQRKAAGARSVGVPPGGQPAAGGCRAVSTSTVAVRGAPACTAASPARRAPRALEDVEKVLTGTEGNRGRHRGRQCVLRQ